jgi:hypothetical protein
MIGRAISHYKIIEKLSAPGGRYFNGILELELQL